LKKTSVLASILEQLIRFKQLHRNHILSAIQRCWIIFLILTLLPAPLYANSSQLSATNNQITTYKIGVLQPDEPSFTQYTANWPDAAQRVSQLVTPAIEIELVTQTLSDAPDQIEPAMEALIAQDIRAIIAPALRVQLWISPAMDEPIQRFSLIEIPSPDTKIETLQWELINRLSQEPVVRDVLRKLKFEGNLQDTLLLPVENDLFGPTGEAVFNNLLDNERISYGSQPLAEAPDVCARQLRELKFATPDATLIISASAGKAEGVIDQARNKIGLTGPMIVMTGDYQPILFDLTKEGTNNLTTGQAWPIQMEPSQITKLASDLQLAPEAVPFLGALWATVIGIEATDNQSQSDFSAILEANQLAENNFFASGFGPSLLFQLYVMPMFLESWLSVDWWALASEWVVVY